MSTQNMTCNDTYMPIKIQVNCMFSFLMFGNRWTLTIPRGKCIQPSQIQQRLQACYVVIYYCEILILNCTAHL